jgi:hypothetical protein
VPPTKPPSNGRTEADFADWLADYDESLAAGRETAVVDPAAPSGEHVRRFSACLERLETLWPRASANLVGCSAPQPSLDEIARHRDEDLRGRRFGRFIIDREMGRGGHGVVFLAFDPILKRRVALKVPRPDVLVTADLRRRFLREAQAAAVLDHPNIVSIFETGETGPACYLAAAYCNGPTLSEWMHRRSSKVPPRQAALIALRMAEALQHAHDKQIFHRDFKPSNILLEPRTVHPFHSGDESLPFTPKLTDFGLAKVVEEGCGDDTRTGAILGTPRYMAPEQAEGRLKDVGPATDVHGVGVTLYEMLAGQPPYLGAGDGETLHLVRTAEPTPPSKHRDGVPRDLEAICLKCLEKEIDQRYPTAALLAEDLRRFLADQPTVARPIQWPDRVLRWARREPMGAAFAVGCVLAALSISSTWVWYTLKVHAAAELAASFGRDVNDRDRTLRNRLAAAELQLAVHERLTGRPDDAVKLTSQLAADRHAAAALGSSLHLVQKTIASSPESRILPALTQRWKSATASPEGACLIGITNDGVIERFDREKERLAWTLTLRYPPPEPIEWRWSPDGCRVAGMRPGGTVFIVDRQGELLFEALAATWNTVLPCSRQSPNLLLAIEQGRGLVALRPGGGFGPLPSGKEGFADVVLFKDETGVLLLRRHGGIKVVDLKKEEVTLALPSPTVGGWSRVALDDSRRFAAAFSIDGDVAFWDLQTGRRWRGESISKPQSTIAFRFLEDAKTLVHAAGDGRVSAWHVPTGKRFLCETFPGANVYDYGFDERGVWRLGRQAPASKNPMAILRGVFENR